MEKYRHFSDKGTGINPFVPPWANDDTSSFLSLFTWVCRVPLILLRIFLLTVPLMWLALSYGFSHFLPINVIRYNVQKFLYSFGYRWLLFLLGFSYIAEEIADHRRLRIRPPKEDNKSVYSKLSHGNVVLSNHTSFVEILYLGMRLNPTFTLMHKDGTLSEVSFVCALRHSLSFSIPVGPGFYASLGDLCQYVRNNRQGPVVVFPEGCKTNGSCILEWKVQSFLDANTAQVLRNSCSLVGFHYGNSFGYSPQHTVNGWKLHILLICSRLWHPMTVVWLGPASVKTSIAEKSASESVIMLRTLMNRMVQGSSIVDVSGDKLGAFSEYWSQTYRKEYKKNNRVIQKN